MHSSGVHSVRLSWLEKLQISHLISTSPESLNLSEFKSSEFTHLISTQPFSCKPSETFLIGLACLNGFGNTSCMLISVNNRAEFGCVNVQRTCALEKAKTKLMTESKDG